MTKVITKEKVYGSIIEMNAELEWIGLTLVKKIIGFSI